MWHCKCDCGKELDVSKRNLTSHGTRSCGCIKEDYYKEMYGKSQFNTVYMRYVKRAKKKNIEFVFTKEDFVKLTSQNCYYCGREPSSVGKSQHNNGDFKYNGLDRINSSGGYTFDNVVTCCEFCNRSKFDRTTEEFYIYIQKIYNYLVDNKKIIV